jgi:hypothetical protein
MYVRNIIPNGMSAPLLEYLAPLDRGYQLLWSAVMLRVINLATVVFWTSAPLFGVVLIVPWLRFGWLAGLLAIPVGVSAGLLGWYSQASSGKHGKGAEMIMYIIALYFALNAFLFSLPYVW